MRRKGGSTLLTVVIVLVALFALARMFGGETSKQMAVVSDSDLGPRRIDYIGANLARKDLVREMVARLKRDIMVASNRLDAMRPPR